MAEDNPIEGLDPNQSAFEPMLDMMNQDIPEDLSRTTTTTTLYISGDQTQIDQPQEPVKEEDPIKTAVDNFRLYQQQEGMSANVGDVNKLFPNTSAIQRLQLVQEYSDLFREDNLYNNRVEQIYKEGLDSGKTSLEILESISSGKNSIGSRVGLMKRFPNLFSETAIQADQKKKVEDEKLIAQDQEKQKKIKDLNAEYDKATDFNQKRRIGDQIKKLENDQEYLDKLAKDSDYQTETSRSEIGKLSSFFTEDFTPAEFPTAEFVDTEKLEQEQRDLRARQFDIDYVEPIIEGQQELDVFEGVNTVLQSGLDNEDYLSVYKEGKYNPEKHEQYDKALAKMFTGIITKDPIAKVHASFYERNGIDRRQLELRNDLILQNVPNLDVNKIYTQEEQNELVRIANSNFLKKYGDIEFDELKVILGPEITPMDYYNESLKNSKNTVSPLNIAVVENDEDQTLENLQELFPENTSMFRFSKTNLDGQDAITIRTYVAGEMLKSVQINLDESNEPLRKIRKWMSEANPPAYIQDKLMTLYTNPEESEFVDENGKINERKIALFATMHPGVFGSMYDYSADDLTLGGLRAKSIFMINPEEIRKEIEYANQARKNQTLFMFDQTRTDKKLVPEETIQLLESRLNNATRAWAEEKKQKGTGIAAAIGQGIATAISSVDEVVVDTYINLSAALGYTSLSDEEEQELLDRGLTRNQIVDIEQKYRKKKFKAELDNLVGRLSKTDQIAINESGFLTKGFNTIANSLTTMAFGGGSKRAIQAAFALTTGGRLMNELEDSDLSTVKKLGLVAPMAMIEGVLEEFGMQSAIRQGLTPLKKQILLRAFKDLPKDASFGTLKQSIKKVINEMAGGAINKVSKAMAIEALTEAGQSGAEILETNLINSIFNHPLFQDAPDITTAQGIIEAGEIVVESIELGAFSGGIINVSSQGLSKASEFLSNKSLDFNSVYSTLTDNQSRDLMIDRIDLKVLKGELSEQDATTIKENFNKAYPIMMEIPSELSSDQKQQSYDLLLERNKLEEQVKDKDKNLVVKQTERIAEINNQLQQISKTDAVQEQETKEEVLPDEQPEMGLQEVGQRDTKDQQEEISPENSSNYANLTEDQEGNVVFFHRGQKGYDTVKPSSGKTRATSREEAAAVGKVGGVAMYYTDQNDSERAVSGDAQYAVKVPKSKVYDANTDSKNIKEEAKKRHEQENPGKAFDANTELAYVTKIAGEQGYQMVVAQWDGKTRAQTTQELTPTDVQEVDGNTVTKSFNEKYESNKDKGFVPVIPATQEEGLTEVYKDIQSEKSRNKEYDDVYFLFDSRSREKYSQEQITNMINDSNLSQEIKDKYNNIMQAKPESRRSEKTRDNIAGVEIKYPNAEQTEQRKAERTKPEYVDNAAKQNEQEDVESLQKELEGEFGMLTGENPLGKPLTEEENKQLNEKAEEWLKKKGYKPRRITGKYGQAENSFFVPGLTKQDAIAFAKEFNQESVAHSEGMIYQDGKMNPRKKSDDNFKMEQYSPESDFVSVVNTKDGLKTFAVGYDFNKEEDSTTKPKPKKKKVPKKEAKGIRKQIENARKAIAKILPGVEIVVHENEDSYRKATDETDGKKQASRGEYDSKTNKIHINVSKANNRTVAHEVFHAILMNRLKTDKATQDITERMIKALSKNLEGMPEVKQALDAFAANYDENIQSEEKLAELVGILAGNYAQMNKPSQSLIKRFLDRLAKMFGLKSFTDGEVVDLLNTIAGKVAVGAEISDVDIKVIPKNKTAEIKEANKRFQADFTDLKSGVTYSFDKNTNEFKKIEQKYITRNKSISDFNNVFMILHQPDSAFSGKISKKLSDGSEILVEGKGGIFYPIKFHEKGYFWASTSKAAQAMAESMNKAINKDGKIYMALTTAPTNKVLSSTNAANGVMNLFISLSKNPKFKITGIESILIKSYNKAFGDKIDSSNNLDEIVKIIEEKLGAEKSSFDDRKTFSTSIIDSVVKSIQRKKSNQDAQNSLADFFGEGMMAEDLVTKFKKGSKISKANLTEAVSQMLTEPMLRDGKSKTENGSIYAILEIEGEVEAVDAKSETDHESYPKAIKSKGDSKTTLHLLTDRVKWNNVTIDPDTGKTVNKSGKVKSKDPKKKGTLVERWTQIMSPSAGITTQGVKIDTSEVTTPAKRKQKDDGPSRERVDKIIDGIVQKLEDRRLKKLEKDRTRGPLTAKEKLDATISYLKGSKLYQESTDLEREQIVRQLTEDLGIKIKKAPSVRKVLGKKKRTKVVVDQLAEYKRQIKEWNKSARLAKKDLNTRRKELAKLVKSMVRQGIMTSKQAGILVERSNIVNLENEEILNRFLDYAEKVFKNAEYAEKLRQASSIRKKIKRNLKKDNQAEVIAMAKQFAEIDPQMVEVLDLYMDYAEQMNDALKSSRIKGGEVDMRQAANLAEIAEFYQGAIDNQNKILKKEMIAKYQDLNLDENMSINEIKEIVEAIESGDVKQGLEAEVMSFLSKRFGVMSAIAKDMIKRKINPFTGETIDLTDHQIDMVSRLIDADLSTMDVKDAIKFVEYIDNFITNEITSGLESAISIYEGVRSIRNLAKRLIKARMPKLGSLGLNLLSEDLGRIWNQYLTSMPVLFDRIFQGTNRGLKVMKEIGLQDIINGKAKKIRVHKNIMDQYKKEFIEGDKKFMEAENVYERGMIAFMSRNLVGTVAEQKAEFERRKRLVLESIEYLENSGNKQERKKAEVYREVYGKLDIASAKDINSIREKASKKNIDAVSWWTDQWADKYNDLADVSLSVHNTILGTDTNYTPDKYKTLSSRVDISKEDLARSVEETGAFMSGTHIDRSKSGVLMETTRPKTLPKNRYVSFDFDMDNSLSMDKALTDIYTSAAIQKFYGATRSSSFEEVFGDTSSMVLERVSDYIRDLKGKGEYMSNKEISKIFNTVAKFGVSKALGGMSQALKQTIPVMMNTLTNAGRFDFANKSDLDWVNNSDMAIVNRGIESETAIESADASVEINLDNIRTIMRGVDKLQGLYLKAFLQGPDVYVAKSSFISYYKQHMQRNGLSTELVEGEYNQDALEYAQMMVDRQQNVSDPALAGTFLSKAGNVAIVRKVIAPFASFVINQKGRMMADLRVLNPTNTTPTNEDKKAAARSLAGLMVELTVFHTLSAVIREGFKSAAKGLFGDEDEDKEEKEWGSLESNKKFWDAASYAFSSVAKDILSPFPFVGDGLVSEGLNMLLENLDVNLADEDDVQAAIDAENELRLLKRKDPMTDKEKKELREKVMEQGKISVYEDDAVLKTLGVLSIGKDAIKDLNDAYMLYKNGEYEQQGAFGKKKRYVLERDREGLGSIILGKFFTVTGLAPKDVGDIARYGMKEIKKKSISEKQYEKYQEVKKDLKRNPTEAEEYLIVNSGRKAKDITDDINRINKYFEGLTLDQMKEFVEAEKYGLHRGQWAIRNIKEGKTAKELTKERNIPTESKSMFSTRKGE